MQLIYVAGSECDALYNVVENGKIVADLVTLDEFIDEWEG